MGCQSNAPSLYQDYIVNNLSKKQKVLFNDRLLLLLKFLRLLQPRHCLLIPLYVRFLVFLLNTTLLIDHRSESALLQLLQLLVECAWRLLDLLAFGLAELPESLVSCDRPRHAAPIDLRLESTFLKSACLQQLLRLSQFLLLDSIFLEKQLDTLLCTDLEGGGVSLQGLDLLFHLTDDRGSVEV